jgi:hypothetical protein
MNRLLFLGPLTMDLFSNRAVLRSYMSYSPSGRLTIRSGLIALSSTVPSCSSHSRYASYKRGRGVIQENPIFYSLRSRGLLLTMIICSSCIKMRICYSRTFRLPRTKTASSLKSKAFKGIRIPLKASYWHLPKTPSHTALQKVRA